MSAKVSRVWRVLVRRRGLCRSHEGTGGSRGRLLSWNFPIGNPARKLGAAIGAGCSIIIKPAEEARPASASRYSTACSMRGIAEEVASCVSRARPGVAASSSPPHYRKVSFTGSVAVGKHLDEVGGGRRQTHHHGTRRPWSGAWVSTMRTWIAPSISRLVAESRNAGQVCISPTRFYVQEGIYERFVRHSPQEPPR